jgi:myosin-1
MPPSGSIRAAAATETRRTKSTRGRVESARLVATRDATIKSQRVTSEPSKGPEDQATQKAPELAKTQSKERVPRPATRARVASKDVKSVSPTDASQAPPKPTGTLLQERPIRIRATRTASQPKEVPAPAEVQIEVKMRTLMASPETVPLPLSSPQLEFTDPANVLARATELRNNLISALSSKPSTRAISGSGRTFTLSTPLPFVSKWVDYSKKHGIGYVLADGSIGCVLIGTPKKPVTHVVVRNGYTYLSKPFNDALVSIGKIPLKFYIQRPDGSIELKEMAGDRRKVNGILWAKFGRYMCQTLSSGSAEKKESSDEDGDDDDPRQVQIVRFYQRVGTVGVWGFSNGCFQVSFIRLFSSLD